MRDLHMANFVLSQSGTLDPNIIQTTTYIQRKKYAQGLNSQSISNRQLLIGRSTLIMNDLILDPED